MDLSLGGVTRLSWPDHQPHLSAVVSQLQLSSSLVDVTITCSSGQTIRCHKIILAAASPYFQTLFSENTAKVSPRVLHVLNPDSVFQHPVVLLPHVDFPELQDVVQYVYRGEVSLPHARLPAFLSLFRSLQLSGLEQFVKKDIKDIKDEDVVIVETPVFHPSEPQDLSMKSPLGKRRRLDSCTLPSPSPAHDARPESSAYCSDPRPGPHDFSSSPAQPVLLTSCPTTAQVIKAQMEQEKVEQRRAKEAKEVKQEGSKVPPWSQNQLQEAIEAVITQKLRFTQASAKYGIPKGTLYDNILGKSKRMLVLDQVGLTEDQEVSVLEFCCEISSMPYNRRTSRSLRDIREFIAMLKSKGGKGDFLMSMRQGFKWWWAFTKKHSIISLYYESQDHESDHSPPPALLSLVNDPSSTHITIPTSPLPIFPFLGLNGNSRFSKTHLNLPHSTNTHFNVT